LIERHRFERSVPEARNVYSTGYVMHHKLRQERHVAPTGLRRP
jgi:hypothetical protein